MTAPTTYATLLTEIENFLARTLLANDDSTDKVPSMVRYAEIEMNNDLRIREMISTTTITTSTVNKFVALPTGFLELIALADDLNEPLMEVDYETLLQYQYGTGAGRPEYFNISHRIDFERVDGAARSFPIRYYKRLDLITDLSNDVLTNYPNIYLYGALLQSQAYIKNPEELILWKTMYDEAVKKANTRNITHDKKLRTELAPSNTFNVIRGF